MNKKNTLVIATVVVSIFAISPIIEAGKIKFFVTTLTNAAEAAWKASASLRKGSIDAMKEAAEEKTEDFAKASVKYVLTPAITSVQVAEAEQTISPQAQRSEEKVPPVSLPKVAEPENEEIQLSLLSDRPSPKQTSKAKLVSFTVKTMPSNASIKIMNIGPKYTRGMKLPPGRYDIKVSSPNYNTKRFWINVDDKNNIIQTALLRQSNSVPFTVITTPENATVKIMNIGQRYKDKINLKKGQYDIQVSLDGYRTKRFWVDVDEKFNTIQADLSKKGQLKCNPVIKQAGNWLSNQYNQKHLMTQEIPGITLDELYFSYAENVDKSNYLKSIGSAINDDFAYFDLIQPSHLNLKQMKSNAEVYIDPERNVPIFVGMEATSSGVILIEYAEVPKGAFLAGIEKSKEAFCLELAEL